MQIMELIQSSIAIQDFEVTKFGLNYRVQFLQLVTNDVSIAVKNKNENN